MQYTNIQARIQNYLTTLKNSYPLLAKMIPALHKAGGTPYLVGGAVRDLFLDRPTKDIDIEVHGMSLDDLEKTLAHFGPVSLVGKAFGVLRLHHLDIDWSIPRSDSAGRHPQVDFDPHLPLEQAFARRDVTINAMGINLLSGNLVDPFNGLADLHRGILRAPDPKLFVEDPLRFYRVMQFIGRLNMQPDEELNHLCATMNLHGVALERIAAEFEKLFLQSKTPSVAFRWLATIGRLQELFPEIAATHGVPQDPDWHPEGDVWEHTLQAVDAAELPSYENDNEHLMIVMAALCHDLGKVTTTEFKDGHWKAHGHDVASERIAKRLLPRISMRTDVIKGACLLVRHHMDPGQFVKNEAKPAAYKRLALKLAPYATIQQLALLMLADSRAKNPAKNGPLTGQVSLVNKFLELAQNAHVLYAPEPPILLGRDLLDTIRPGPQMGELLKKAYQIQIDEGVTDKEELKRRILEAA